MQPFNRISKRLFTCLLVYLSTHRNRSTVLNGFVENKPNLCHFCTKNRDSTQKRTQFKPKTKPFSPQKTNPLKKQTQTNPTCLPLHVSGRGPCEGRDPVSSLLVKPPKSACGITKFCKAKNNKYEVEKYKYEITKR